MEEVITNAYSVGGLGLVAILAICWGIRWMYGQFKSLNEKIDELTQTVQELKVQSTKYKTLIRSCQHEDCKIKQYLTED